RGLPVRDTWGSWTGAALGHVWGGLFGGAVGRVVGGIVLGSAINNSPHPITENNFPERKLVKAYTDTRLPMAMNGNLKVADVIGMTEGQPTGIMQKFTTGNAEKAGTDREAAIAKARARVLDSHVEKDEYGDKQPRHEPLAVLQTM